MTSSNVHVIKRGELKRFIQDQQKSASLIFSQVDIQAIYNQLLPQMQISKAMKKKNIFARYSKDMESIRRKGFQKGAIICECIIN